MTTRGWTARLSALAVTATLLAACTASESDPAQPEKDDAPTREGTSAVAAPDSGGDGPDADDPALDAALSEPSEDRVYPQVGDPGVDALHYQLDLAWTPRSRHLDAVETLVFRSTVDSDTFQLDFGQRLTASSVRVDGEEVEFVEDGKDLVVTADVVTDQRYTVEIAYSGTPQPVAAPTTRSDFSTTGWTITDQGETWTMQEPFGAYSWYAVNDHPSDKALYDFTLSVPAPWTGVANGILESREVVDGNTVTEWHLDEPAASYLVTVAMGDFAMSRGRSESGVPMTFWTPRGNRAAKVSVRAALEEIGWIEERLGAYPFSSLGVLVVDSRSGMETQTMITLGDTSYTLSPEVIVHEMVHQWYGNQVTPQDWRDVWMNEGMTMYLQAMWESQHYGVELHDILADWHAHDTEARRRAGPPADYDPTMFGDGNIYYLPALMWDQLRRRLGDETFFEIARAWPVERDNDNAAYADITSFWSQRSGEDLTQFFDTWLLGDATPAWP